MIETGLTPIATPHGLTDVRATTGEYVQAGMDDVLLQSSPVAAYARERERKASTYAQPLEISDELQALDLQERERDAEPGPSLAGAPPRPDRREVLMLTPEEATQAYGDLGLKFKAPIGAREAELLAETKRRELSAGAVFLAARAPSFDGGGLGSGRAALSLTVDFLGAALDPINFASALLPIVGPAGRAMFASRLGTVGGAAAAGVIEGAVGNALLEPAMAGAAAAEQRDYQWWDFAASVVLGGVLGGTLGGIGGWWGRGSPSSSAGAGLAPPAGSVGGPPVLPSPGGPPAPAGFLEYAGGWKAALETTGQPVPRDIGDWPAIAAWNREAPMVRALEGVSPETRRIVGTVATMQYLGGRPIDVEPVLRLDSDWKAPQSDTVVKLQRLVDERRIAGLLEPPRMGRKDPLATTVTGQFGDFAPRELTVDAKRFQFKAGGDKAGVTDRLKGVEKWDQRLAGLSIVWEGKNGKRYVVDGHQRHGLATRLEKAGQKPKIHAITLREADGETEGYARALAAFKNIAEGSGTAIDAAKILRETRADATLKADLDSGRLPQLPPSSALVRDAGALAELPDAAFGIVAAGKVEPSHAAHVTRILSDPKQQTAAIEMLAKLGPDTAEQARLIVEQIRAAGFREGETVDLFGRQDVAASLMLERAKVLEAAARAIKKDATVFRTLVERENVAAEAGNVLARDANVERLTDDKIALTVLEALANRAGPLSTALNVAARALSEGKTLRSVTGDFLKAVRVEASALKPQAIRGELGAMSDVDALRKSATNGDTIGDPAALERQARDAASTPKDQYGSPEKIAEAELERVRAEAEQAIAAHPELKADLEAADAAAAEADLFGKATEALAGCRVTGGS